MSATPTSRDEQAWQPVCVSGAQTRLMRAESNGRSYQISVWIPAAPPPSQGFPVIYVLDANALFGTFVEAIRRSSRRQDATGIGPAVVVGIGWPEADLYAPQLRQMDYTAGPAAGADAKSNGQVGGASGFLSFIEEQLMPELSQQFGLDRSRQTLFGHSLAGFFALHALLERPRLFQTVAAISPSLWWDADSLRARLNRLTDSDVRVFMAVGEWEDALPPWQRNTPQAEHAMQRRAQRQMVAQARQFAQELQDVVGTGRLVFHEFPEEDHMSILMIATQRALRFAFAAGA